jgi:hypothetical protein
MSVCTVMYYAIACSKLSISALVVIGVNTKRMHGSHDSD